MSTGKVYKQAIKRVFAEKYHDERMAVYWGREDATIHVIASLRHYVHKIADANEDAVKMPRPVRNMRRRPSRSAARPPRSSRLPKISE